MAYTNTQMYEAVQSAIHDIITAGAIQRYDSLGKMLQKYTLEELRSLEQYYKNAADAESTSSSTRNFAEFVVE